MEIRRAEEKELFTYLELLFFSQGLYFIEPLNFDCTNTIWTNLNSKIIKM